MCLLYFCQNDTYDLNGYLLVMVNNRDEIWNRPTLDAGFWGPQHSCISGLDMYKGKEGGTWLGMNKNGKIGVLLNMLGHMDASKKGRGFLVSDYISKDCEAEDYAAKIYEERYLYNGFNLLLFDLGKQKENGTAKPVYLTQAKGYNSYVERGTLPANTCIGVSNSPLEYPFQKVTKGKERFSHIVSQYPSVHTKDHLVHELMELMADKTSLLPDPVMEKAAGVRGVNPGCLSCRSAINTFSPKETYGTRTTTVILIDGQGTVDYIERTVEPWEATLNPRTVHRTFKIDSTTQGVKPNAPSQPSVGDGMSSFDCQAKL